MEKIELGKSDNVLYSCYRDKMNERYRIACVQLIEKVNKAESEIRKEIDLYLQNGGLNEDINRMQGLFKIADNLKQEVLKKYQKDKNN